MKQGTLYAKRLKEAFHKLKAAAGKGGESSGALPPEPTNPTEQLVLASLGESTSLATGRKAYHKLLETMIDLNEIRVSSPGEVAAAIGHALPDAAERADALVRALNAVFKKEHAVSLERLKGMGVREARTYLEELNGVTPYAAAAVIHWSLQGHAIPVNTRLAEALKAAGLAHPQATPDEIQAFLERHVSAGDAHQFVAVMESFAQTQSPRTANPRPARAGGSRAVRERSASAAGRGAARRSG